MKMLKMKHIFSCVLLVIGMQSCVTFERKEQNPYMLNKENVKELSGSYQISQVNADSIFKKYPKNTRLYNNFLTEIDRKLLKDTLKLDSNSTYRFDLDIINDKQAKISYIENGKTIRVRNIRVKLKKDGYLYLKNKNVGFVIIPYLAGAIDIKKTRMTKTTNGNLIFDVVNHRSGAFMIIAFLDGRTWKYRQEYERL